MNLDDFDFDLPDTLIATRPVTPRRDAALLHFEGGNIADRRVFELPDLLQEGDRLIINNTKVIPARLNGLRRRLGAAMGGEARVEVTLMKNVDRSIWSALIKPLKKVSIGETIYFEKGLEARLLDKSEGQAQLEFNEADQGLSSVLDTVGQMPLPPYIANKRPTDERDKVDYQTIFASKNGSVAAPTASLHFDDPLLRALKSKKIDISYITLHVGAGTFLPVKVDSIHEHKMHSEYGEVGEEAVSEITQTRLSGGRIIPVGTTALRLIETAAPKKGVINCFANDTNIFIYPGYEFKITDALMTNFHLPKSTLIMLVAALIGYEDTMRVYKHAIHSAYRFFSYGDASLLCPNR